MRRVYLTGADGLLGTALRRALSSDPATARWALLGVSIADFDIGDAAAVRRSMARFRPDTVIHTAAHAIVDDCEMDPQLALRVNVAGVRNVADCCRELGSRLVNISSDYVFDGRQPPPGGYGEHDLPSPRNAYGLTKLAGEHITAQLPDHLNVRTSWLFGGPEERVDQVLHLVRRAQRGEPAELIHDQFSRPTYTADLAQAIVFLLTRDEQVRGTIHIANEGRASWYQVGRFVAARLGIAPAIDPMPVTLGSRGFLGTRPRDSTLNTDRLAALGYTMPSWRDAVTRFCVALGVTTDQPATEVVPDRTATQALLGGLSTRCFP
jgi:dTDP-4-dehydrorhamnose reductase